MIQLDVLFSAKVAALIRKHGPDVMMVDYWSKAILQSEDGQPLSTDYMAELLCFYTGLDIEQIDRCFGALIESGLLQKTRENFIFSETVCSDIQKIRNKRETYRQNISKRWEKPKESVPVDTMVLQSNYNGNTNQRNQNQNTDPDLEVKRGGMGGKTRFDFNQSVTKAQYIQILKDPELGNNDSVWLKNEYKKFADHAKSTGAMSEDWAAAFSLWLRRGKSMVAAATPAATQTSRRIAEYRPPVLEKAGPEIAKAAFAEARAKLRIVD